MNEGEKEEAVEERGVGAEKIEGREVQPTQHEDGEGEGVWGGRERGGKARGDGGRPDVMTHPWLPCRISLDDSARHNNLLELSALDPQCHTIANTYLDT